MTAKNIIWWSKAAFIHRKAERFTRLYRHHHAFHGCHSWWNMWIRIVIGSTQQSNGYHRCNGVLCHRRRREVIVIQTGLVYTTGAGCNCCWLYQPHPRFHGRSHTCKLMQLNAFKKPLVKFGGCCDAERHSMFSPCSIMCWVWTKVFVWIASSCETSGWWL